MAGEWRETHAWRAVDDVLATGTPSNAGRGLGERRAHRSSSQDIDSGRVDIDGLSVDRCRR